MNKKKYGKLLLLTFAFILLSLLPVNVSAAAKYKYVVTEKGTYCYKNEELVKKKFVTIKQKKYYFDSSGIMKKDCLFTVNGKEYFAGEDGVIAINKFVMHDNKRYFFNTKGVRETGWINHNGHTYYCAKSGKIYRNCWKKIGKYTYYFTSSYYIRKNHWVDDFYVDAKGHKTAIQLTATSETYTKKEIKMSNLKQYPELPTGCESVALTMVLKYYGFPLSKTTIASNYLPKSSTNFVTAFWGSPFSSSGGGIYSPGLTTTANSYLSAKNSSLKAYDITGTNLTDLYRYIDSGIPVIVWNSMYMNHPVAVYSYYCKGKTWYFYQSEHCVVLCGYDKENKKVLINDSLSGLVWRSESSFKRIYNKLGKMAVVIK